MKLSEKDLDNIIIGFDGENIIREFFKLKKIFYFQADMVAKIKYKWCLIEVKHQEMFNSPPFDGHGLPLWQIKARLQFQEEKDIRAMLFIIDKNTNIIYWQYMDVLMKGEKYQTNGKSPRIIFPIKNYNILKTKP